MLTITFLDEGSETGEASLDIVLERLNEEGTTDELRLEGDLDDARSLVSTLESEGNCVVVEIAPPEEGEGEEEAPGEDYEVPDASEEVPEPAESLAPVSP